LGTIRNFEELEAWTHARGLVGEVYSLTAGGRFAKDFGLRDQIRRAGVSIMANIAEGYERDGTGEFIQFLSIAKGSAGEVKCHLYIARDQNYLNQEQFDHLLSITNKVGKLIGGLINYLRRSGVKGNKFKSPKLET
jgi:four helix bundle protein